MNFNPTRHFTDYANHRIRYTGATGRVRFVVYTNHGALVWRSELAYASRHLARQAAQQFVDDLIARAFVVVRHAARQDLAPDVIQKRAWNVVHELALNVV